MDRICIEGLQLFARHGVFPEENEKGQHFVVHAALLVDTEAAGIQDDLSLSVDYAAVCEVIRDAMTSRIYQLIETAAQETALAILHAFPSVNSVELEVCKPEAPIPMTFRSVSVKIQRGWHTAVIALGSNMGDSEGFLNGAVQAFRESRYFRHVQVSDFLWTKPYGYTEQADFLNGVVLCETVYSPHALLDVLQAAEQRAGRERKLHWGPRTLDLDLIFYEDKIISDARLQVPHPGVQDRAFVLAPLVQLAPYYWHPVLHKTAAQLLEDLA